MALGGGVQLRRLLRPLVVGVGQAGAGATNGPLVADFIPPERRATTLGIVALGATVGIFLGLVLGGFGIAAIGWRATFALGGASGLAFAALFRFAVQEPPRGWSEGRTEEAGERPGLGAALATIAALRTFRHMALGAILASMALFASAQWGVAFLQRSHGLSNQSAGVAAGVVGLLATLGAVAGGMFADRMWMRNARGVLLLPAVWPCGRLPLDRRFQSPTLAPAVALLAAASSIAIVHGPPSAPSPRRSRRCACAA
jgi:predicted MFS family arabinose efflux permease